MKTETTTTKTFWANIYIAGNLNLIENTIRKTCLEDGIVCVTVTPTNFIYTGGEESGVVIGLINYGRFPRPDETLKEIALKLGHLVMEAAFQTSFSIMFPDETIFVSRRDAVAKLNDGVA